MASEIPWEIREEAEGLYIIDGLTFEAVAAKLDVAVNTLKGWAKAEGWRERRYEYRSSRRRIEEKTQKLRLALVDNAINDPGSPLAAYAFARVEQLIIEKQKKKATVTAADVEKIAKKGGLSDDAAAQIRQKILGITE